MRTADALRHDVKVIGLVGVAHGLSHFFQIATAVLFPLIKDDLGVSYAALGATVGLYYTVSAICQTLAGFAVDRFGARRVLFAGLGMAIAGAALASLAQNYAMLLAAAVVGGMGNSVFHPVDFTILNARVTKHRLGYAFSWHGIAGYLGFAAAPAYGIAMATAFDWRTALLGAAAIGAVVTALLAAQGGELQAAPVRAQAGAPGARALVQAPVLLCFGYFVMLGVAFIAMQSFGISAMVQLYGTSVALASAALTANLIGAAVGVFAGGFVAVRAARHDLVAVGGMAASALLVLLLASAWLPAATLPLLLGVSGFAAGVVNPSRDLLVRAATPAGATGKVYGFVYSGLDAGSIAAPVIFGWLLDNGAPAGVFYAVVGVLALSILTVLRLPARAPQPT
ncbi:MAG: MFS transporter [Betaproteobacteria bacterium]|nr:MFS transporter [Betaproteobacteria bacterium]MDH5351377.1 MFS transporter [Betaproteobacteria bacterium]